ncbi:hypothetical protein RJ640_013395 [Escallonia rubra]|uniref:Uncharacterized protein n=1 Tax=Escallonia rubra TaxID=112253 RepID=A0AA88UET0_9ASTE|nr:hypothetical protein RJ640_013395 [Escallonia rubra]
MIIFPARTSFTIAHSTSRYHTCATLLQLLQLSIDHQSAKLAKQSHSLVCHLSLHHHPVILTKLVSAYCVSRRPVDSLAVFNSVRVKNVYLYNTLINGFAKNQLYAESFLLFKEMCGSEVSPDEFTLSTLAKVSGHNASVLIGKMVHGTCVRTGFVLDCIVANSLMSMYCKCGGFDDARKVFDEMPLRSVSSWNVMIGEYAVSGGENFEAGARGFVARMEREGLKPDAFTVSSLLPFCGSNYGRELHCYILKNELEVVVGSDVRLGCCMIDMYSKGDKVDVGRRVFDQMKRKNVYVWTAMINGYVQNGDKDEAMFLFREMQGRGGIEPNKVSLLSVLPACSSFAGLMGGKQVHGFAYRKEFICEVSLCNALIDMYLECGSLNYSRRVFESNCFCRDAISWSSMISGYGLHGMGQEAIVLFDQMLRLGIKLDAITIVGVLSACSRSGLVKEGLIIYNTVVTDFGIKPTLEICACMVDMLSRSGRLDKALNFITNMPVKPGPSVWGALVSAAILHGDSEMKDLAYRSLIEIEPENPSNYVSLSNLYASSRRWDGVSEVRTTMKERGLKKLPGCSWISIDSETLSFYVADKAQHSSDMIYKMLDELIIAMKGAEFSPDFEILT